MTKCKISETQQLTLVHTDEKWMLHGADTEIVVQRHQQTLLNETIGEKKERQDKDEAVKTSKMNL